MKAGLWKTWTNPATEHRVAGERAASRREAVLAVQPNEVRAREEAPPNLIDPSLVMKGSPVRVRASALAASPHRR